jgi:hypothetical protein
MNNINKQNDVKLVFISKTVSKYNLKICGLTRNIIFTHASIFIITIMIL